MKLRMLDQLHISSVSANTLIAGQEIEVSPALAEELLKKHPDKVEAVAQDGSAPAPAKAQPKPGTKAEPAPANKQEPRPKNKSQKPRSRKKRAA